MLEINNLSKHFGTFKAVNNISIRINEGDLYGFLGPNGAGKTTTIKMIVGLYSPTSGKISLDGKNMLNESIDVKYDFGYIPDQPFLYDKLTGKEFLLFSGGLYDMPPGELNSRIDELVDIFKIGDWLNKRTEEYSQGMRQRITIASAFLHNPKLLIIDEPMVGLDPQSAHIVKKVLKEKVEAGLAVFMSTHSLNVVEEICNRVGIINHGKIIYDDTVETLHRMKEEKNNTFERLFIELTDTDLEFDL